MNDEKKYRRFKDLPPEIAEKLRKQIVAKHSIYNYEPCPNPEFIEKELEEIVDAFVFFNNAVGKGLPNQLYKMLYKALDTEIAQRAHAANTIWYSHEGVELAQEHVQDFADMVKREIDKRAEWDEEDLHKEYYLNKRDQKE